MELNFVVRKSGREFGLTLEGENGDVFLCCGFFKTRKQMDFRINSIKKHRFRKSDFIFKNTSGNSHRFKLINKGRVVLGFSVTYANKELMESSVRLIMAFAKEAEVVQS